MRFKIVKNGEKIEHLDIFAEGNEVDDVFELLGIARGVTESTDEPVMPIHSVEALVRLLLPPFPNECTQKVVAQLVATTCKPEQKHHGIKLLRVCFGLGIREAKDLYESCL